MLYVETCILGKGLDMGWFSKKDPRVVQTENQLHDGDRQITGQELDELIGGEDSEVGDN